MTLSNFVITSTTIASRVEAATRPAIVAYRFLASETMRKRYTAAWNATVFLFCLFVGLAVLAYEAGRKCSLLVDRFVQAHLNTSEVTPCDPVEFAATAIKRTAIATRDRATAITRDVATTGKDAARQYTSEQKRLFSRWINRQAERLAESIALLAQKAQGVVWAGVRRLEPRA